MFHITGVDRRIVGQITKKKKKTFLWHHFFFYLFLIKTYKSTSSVINYLYFYIVRFELNENYSIIRPFTVSLIPHTNLILVVADTTCPCYSAKITVNPTKVPTRLIRPPWSLSHYVNPTKVPAEQGV